MTTLHEVQLYFAGYGNYTLFTGAAIGTAVILVLIAAWRS